MTRALLFDLDGTLVDTEHHHFQAFEISFDQQIYDSEILGGVMTAIAAEFLDRAEELGFRHALVTNAPIASTQEVLAGAGILDRFEGTISAAELHLTSRG